MHVACLAFTIALGQRSPTWGLYWVPNGYPCFAQAGFTHLRTPMMTFGCRIHPLFTLFECSLPQSSTNNRKRADLLRAGKLGNRLCALRNSMLSKLTRKHKANRSLDLPGRDRRLLVITRKPRRLLGELLENIINERIHDAHRLARDSDIRMNLLQDFKDVDLVGLTSLLVLLLLLLVAGGSLLRRQALLSLRLLSSRRLLGFRLLLLLLHRLLGSRLLLRGLLLGLGRHERSRVKESLGLSKLKRG
ncbi:hypothetical protein IEQ34_008526 [Dendrobium chrysotoxum]|uniref:Uncharacterized protein n=1 Tax=Dendrobium chrysotoxum TaxID=161865 RepID=A0AAV7GW64_DENCH|nr:hypothetical protein IEQ34_008526 [Dendrobium chrysotoxum]